MSLTCNECHAKLPEGVTTCPSCGMPVKSALERIAFAHEWQAFVEGERMLLERMKSHIARSKADRRKDCDCLAKVQVAWKKLFVRMCDAGVHPKDLDLDERVEQKVKHTEPPKRKGKKTKSHGSSLVREDKRSLQFIGGHIKIHPDKFHIYFNKIGWYEVGPNCTWRVLDRILRYSTKKPEYQKAPFRFSFTRSDGIALRKAIAVEKGPNGTWPRKKKQISLATAVLDKNPGCESDTRVTTASFKAVIYENV